MKWSKQLIFCQHQQLQFYNHYYFKKNRYKSYKKANKYKYKPNIWSLTTKETVKASSRHVIKFQSPSSPSGLSPPWTIRAACSTDSESIKSLCLFSILKQFGFHRFQVNKMIHLADKIASALCTLFDFASVIFTSRSDKFSVIFILNSSTGGQGYTLYFTAMPTQLGWCISSFCQKEGCDVVM